MAVEREQTEPRRGTVLLGPADHPDRTLTFGWRWSARLGMTTPWFRFSLDLDHDGNWRGFSYEVRSDDRLIKLCVMSEPGPFDTPDEMLQEMLTEVREQYGTQLRLV